jgi:hypothetical protein
MGCERGTWRFSISNTSSLHVNIYIVELGMEGILTPASRRPGAGDGYASTLAAAKSVM